jgi:hypothetical protein
MPVPPGIEALCRALEACGVKTELIPQTVERLTNPPASLWLSASDAATRSDIDAHVLFDGDLGASMLRLNEGTPDQQGTWTNLTRSERKRAERLWNWALGPDALSVTPKGRPPKIDSALVLWCLRVLVEASEETRFKFSRTYRDDRSGLPTGPGWRAFLLALDVARASLDRLVPTAAGYFGAALQLDDPRHAETIAQIAQTAAQRYLLRRAVTLDWGPLPMMW